MKILKSNVKTKQEVQMSMNIEHEILKSKIFGFVLISNNIFLIYRQC